MNTVDNRQIQGMELNRPLRYLYEYRRIFWLVFVIVFSAALFHNLYLFDEPFSRVMDTSDFLTWHILFEFISVMVSFCVFILPHYAYRQNHSLRGIFIANVFLVMGIIDTFHTLSFQGMPNFLVANSDSNRATTFWIIARLVGAVGIAVGSFIKPDVKIKTGRNVFLAVSVVFSAAVLVIVTYFPNVLPAMYIEGAGITPIKKTLEYAVIALFTVAGFMFLRKYIRTRENTNLLYAIAMATSIFSELAFVSYSSVYDIYNYMGHVYKFLAFFIIFRIAFINYIEKPYAALYTARKKLREYSGDLSRLVNERTAELQSANRELNRLNRKFTDDLAYARDIQKSILPVKLPSNEQVTFDAKYYAAESVSGDFYNIFRLDENRIGMYIGDVSGHGVPAAMLTVFLNQSIKTTRELDGNRFEVLSPSRVLTNLYELYNKTHFRDDVYILILYAIYDMQTKELVYSSAGLNTQPLLVKKDSQISDIELRGLPICNLMDYLAADYLDHVIRLESGDKLFFYTDGLVELNNQATGESLTVPDLKEMLAENNGGSCLKLYEELDKKIMHISGGDGLKDDVTFFMLQVR